MKHIFGFGFFALAVLAAGAWAGSQDDQLISLARSGVDEKVLKAYIDAAKGPYHLTPDQIIELKDLGVSSEAIAVALRHDNPKASVSDTAATSSDTSSVAVADPASGTTAATVSEPADTNAATTSESADSYAEDSMSGDEQPEAAAPADSPAQSSLPAPDPDVVSPAVAPAEKDQNISGFYQTLTPYGTWVSYEGQRWWRPNAAMVDPSWAPYCTNGYWAYTDYGWTWASNYSWGWGPFHYGRWWRHPHYGWIWLPGAEWGPAWVSWRTSDAYFGWAPLPPSARWVSHRGFFFNGRIAAGDFEFGLTMGDYFFVPSAHFGERDMWRWRVSRDRAREFYGRTVFIHDNYRISNGRVFNNGPSREMVLRFTHRNPAQVTLVSGHFRPGERIHPFVQNNRQFIIYRPAIRHEAPRTPPQFERRIERHDGGVRPAPGNRPQPPNRQDRSWNGGGSHDRDHGGWGGPGWSHQGGGGFDRHGGDHGHWDHDHR